MRNSTRLSALVLADAVSSSRWIAMAAWIASMTLANSASTLSPTAVDDAAAMRGDQLVHLLARRHQLRQRALFVAAHERAVTRDIGGEDHAQMAFDAGAHGGHLTQRPGRHKPRSGQRHKLGAPTLDSNQVRRVALSLFQMPGKLPFMTSNLWPPV